VIDRSRSVFLALAVAALLAASNSRAQSVSVTYGYDALGRVVSVTYSSGATVTYAYDAAGNRTQVSGVAGCAVWGSFVWGASNWCSSGSASAASRHQLASDHPNTVNLARAANSRSPLASRTNDDEEH
jgi:YD repeat-containing protein